MRQYNVVAYVCWFQFFLGFPCVCQVEEGISPWSISWLSVVFSQHGYRRFNESTLVLLSQKSKFGYEQRFIVFI